MRIMSGTWAVTQDVAEELRRCAQEPERMEAFARTVRRRAGCTKGAGTVRAALARGGSVAVIPFHGMCMHRTSWFGTSLERLAANVAEAAADKSVQAIVLDVDSPGGLVNWVPEAAAVVREARAAKPVVAVADTLAASAAYWVASQADEILVTPSGEAGSVGVYGMHVDMSKALEGAGFKVTLISAGKYKTEGNPFEPLSDDAASAWQADVDRVYDQFVKDVARGRGVAVETVRRGYGEGRVVGAKAAVDLGMANTVGTLSDAIRRAGTLAAQRRQGPAAAQAAAEALRLRRARGA